MVALASSRGGSNRGSTPTKFHGPVPFGPGHAQRTEASCREPVDCRVDLRLHLRRVGRQLQDHLGRALRHLERGPVGGGDGGLGALAHRIERLELDHVVVVQRLIVRQAPEHRQIDGVGVVGA